MSHIVVVGGGITGLAGALALAEAREDGSQPDLTVTLLEADSRLGGKLSTTPFAGLEIDAGADAFLARVPWAIDLCRRLGLADRLISPREAGAYVWSRGRLRRLPAGLALGVPGEIWPVLRSGILSPAGLARAGMEPLLPGARTSGPGATDSLGGLLRARFGGQVLERLVDPLVGGIYAGDADRMSLAATAPQIAELAGQGRSMLMAVRRQRRAAASRPAGPTFYAHPGGMGALVEAIADRLHGAEGVEVRSATSVERIESTPGGGYTLVTGPSAANRRRIDADGVVVATPTGPAAAALRELAPSVAYALDGIEYAGVVMVTLAVPTAAIDRELDATGLLVPKPEQRTLTACSWASTKWPQWNPPGLTILRASAGRAGDDHALDLADGPLMEAVLADLHRLMGLRADPVEVRITRWPASFPQYHPGHLARVAAIEGALAQAAPGVVLAGAAYRGIGIPACVRQGTEAAAAVLARLTIAPANG